MTPTDPHEIVRRDLGAHVLGALDPAERTRVEQHLQTCSDCRREIAELAALPGLLARVDFSSLPGSGEAEALGGHQLHAPDADGGPRPSGAAQVDLDVATVAIGRHRRRRRRIRTIAATSVLAVVALVFVVLPGGVAGPASDLDLAVVDGAGAEHVSGTAQVHGQDWGMTITLELAGLPPDGGYVLWAVAGDGHRTQAASWTATSGGHVQLEGSCYLALERLDRLEVTTPADDVVAVLAPEGGANG